ncbi:hypothetical protein [Devosia sp.]|uniref:hypothetical protein n=1 Tax=Devosia sp. TaxID=1871048 RepID=UPI002FC93FFB
MSKLTDLQFKTSVHQAFPDRSSARAARFAGTSQRTMQKWMSGESDVPQNVSDAIAHQARVADQTDVMRHLEESCQEFLDADGHREALGSILSALYQKMLGKPIE